MPIAAVPAYLGKDFKDASPGLRFGLLLPIWTTRQDQEADVKKRAQAKSREGQEVSDMLARQGMDATIAILHMRERNPLPSLWDKNDFAARKAWNTITVLIKDDQARLTALADRQAALAQSAVDLLHLEARAVAPFTTGLGNEHPLENGFAFLNPYGLPYLPGSGVKGVLRQAASELASGDWGETHGWSKDKRYTLQVGKERIPLSVIDVLLGLEPKDGDTEHVRGALSFWDVIPQIAPEDPTKPDQISLSVEIMTPHQGHYYQVDKKKNPNPPHFQSPHDSGSPNPISFLTVPPGSRFAFHVVCDTARLARLTQNRADGAPDLLADGSSHWKTLLTAAFEHAFEWLGFGAKTAVGYGAMTTRASTPEEPRPAALSATTKAAQKGVSLAPDQTHWANATLKWNKATQALVAVAASGKPTAHLPRDQLESFLAKLPPGQAERLKRKGELKGIAVVVESLGNRHTLVAPLRAGDE